jgi:hypothetical protein
VLTPLDISLPDFNAEQRKNVDSVVAAIRESDVRHVVLLSSLGAEMPGRWAPSAAHGLPAVTGKTMPTARMTLPVHVFHADRGGGLPRLAGPRLSRRNAAIATSVNVGAVIRTTDSEVCAKARSGVFGCRSRSAQSAHLGSGPIPLRLAFSRHRGPVGARAAEAKQLIRASFRRTGHMSRLKLWRAPPASGGGSRAFLRGWR